MKNYALITGASSGIGKEFAKILPSRGYNLVIVARRIKLLEELKNSIEQNYPNVDIICIEMDLTNDLKVEELFKQTKDIFIEVLINNAGFGNCQEFIEEDINLLTNMIKLNIEVPTKLTHHYLQKMKINNKGYICQVASIASYLPTPYYAIYGATKSFLRHLGETLHYELKDYNINHSVLNPGVTTTEFFERANQKFSKAQERLTMPAQKVAQIGVNNLFKNKRNVLPGFINAFTALILTKFVPFKIQAFLVKKDITKSNP